MRKQLCLLLLFVLIAPFLSWAKKDHVPQQLIEALKTARHDSVKINLFLQLSDYYRPKHPEKAINYASLALALAEKCGNDKCRFLAMDKLLDVYYNLKYDLSKSTEVLLAAKTLDTTKITALERARIFGYEGKIHLSLNDYAKSQEAFFRQMKIYEALNDSESMAIVNFDLGRLKEAQGDQLTAISFYKRALEQYRFARNIYGEVKTLNALGSSYGQMDDFKRNLQYCQEALSRAPAFQNKFLLGQINYNIGFGYARLALPDSALNHFETALCLGEELENNWLIAKTSNEFAKLHQACNTDEVLSFFDLGLQAARESENKLLEKDLYASLQDYHFQQGQYEKAYFYLQRLLATNETLSNEEKIHQLINTQIKYETEKKDQENLLLKAKERESKAIIQKQRLQNYALLIGVNMLLLLAFLLFRAFQRKKEYNTQLEKEVENRTAEIKEANQELKTANEKLERSNGELERFASVASHDLKAPLRNIISFLNLIQRKLKDNLSDDIREYFQFATDNAKHMHVLIQDILEFSKLEAKEASNEEVDLNESLLSVVHNLKETMQEKNGIVEASPLPVIQANGVQVLQLFQNLIGNGLKYNQNPQPRVTIEHEKQNEKHLFAIRDNGIGIQPEYHQKVFDMFQRLHTKDEYQGTGIGLSICKKIVDQFEGEIWLESQPGEGTTFFFTVPLN